MKKETMLKKIWQERKKIFEGLANKIVKKDFVEHVSEYRMTICKSCEHLQKKGCIVPGDCCSICGCNLELKTRSLTSNCGLEEVDKEPKWKAVVTEKEETDYNLLDI